MTVGITPLHDACRVLQGMLQAARRLQPWSSTRLRHIWITRLTAPLLGRREQGSYATGGGGDGTRPSSTSGRGGAPALCYSWRRLRRSANLPTLLPKPRIAA